MEREKTFLNLIPKDPNFVPVNPKVHVKADKNNRKRRARRANFARNLYASYGMTL